MPRSIHLYHAKRRLSNMFRPWSMWHSMTNVSCPMSVSIDRCRLFEEHMIWRMPHVVGQRRCLLIDTHTHV